MERTYLKQGETLLVLEGAYVEIPEGAEIITEEEYRSTRQEALDEVARQKSEYIETLNTKKQQARNALVALGLDAELVKEVIK